MHENLNEPAVCIRNVSKSFNSSGNIVNALKNIDFEANKGELTMIVGPSGCGKTTLLSVIAGTLRCNKGGQVEVFKHNLPQMSDQQITDFRRQHVGFIFQQYHLIKTLNILENVSIPLILNGFKRSEALEKADILLEKVGLKGRGNERPQNLSGGQQQRVAIARALVHEPALVICDEPTAALDAESGMRVMELMTEIGKCNNRAVIIVTHDSRIFKYADKIAEMDDGRVISLGNKLTL